MGAALFKRGWGCQIELPPRTTVPRGRLPGRWRSRAASGCRGLHRYLCSYALVRVQQYVYIHTHVLPPPRRRFQLKSTPGVGPDPVPRSLLSSSTRTVLISPPNRRTCFAMHPSSPEPSRLFRPPLSPHASLLSYVHCVINSVMYNYITYIIL